VPYLSEAEHETELDLLRSVEAHLGVTGIVPPATGSSNAPRAVPDVPVPGVVAEPVTAATFPAPTGAAPNAFT